MPERARYDRVEADIRAALGAAGFAAAKAEGGAWSLPAAIEAVAAAVPLLRGGVGGEG